MPFDPDTPIFPAEWALRAVQKGLAVFPVAAGAKSPPWITDWQKRATTNEDEARRFWNDPPDANPAVCPGLSGHGVLDIDVRDGKRGEQTIADIEKELQCKLPETYTVRTPSGGRHAYYSAPGLSSKNGVFDDPSRDRNGVDWKSSGGYVLAEGAHTEAGHYVVEVDKPIAPLPPVWAEYIKARLGGPAGSGASLDRAPACEPDLEENVAAAERCFAGLIRDGQQAVQGSGGDDFTYRVGARLHELGVSPERGVELAAAWDAHNDPPWGPDGLLTKFQNAASYAQEPFGSKSPVASAQELSTLLSETASPVEPYPRPLTAAELAESNFPSIEYLWEPFILAREVTLLYGDGGVGKTSLALHAATAISAGISLFGKPTRQGTVLTVLAEDGFGETKARLTEITASLRVDLASLPLHTWCLPGHDVNLASISDTGAIAATGSFFQALWDEVARVRPALVILDSLSDFANLDETRRLAANTLLKRVFGGISKKIGTAVLVLAHPSKASMADGSHYSGSTAFNNAVRQRLVFEVPAEDEQDSRRRILRIAKANYSGLEKIELWRTGRTLQASDAVPLSGDAANPSELVFNAVVELVRKGIVVQKAGPGSGQKPRDLSEHIKKAFGVTIAANRVASFLNELERAGRLTYTSREKNRSPLIGFRPTAQTSGGSDA